MSWEAISAIGDVVGALGVIASLIFVGAQIRQSAKATKASAYQELVSQIIAANLVHIENPDLIRIIDRSIAGEKLSAVEHVQYLALIMSALRLAQSAYYQSRLGLLDDENLESVVYHLLRHLLTDTGRSVWADYSAHSEPGFRKFVEDRLDRTESYSDILRRTGRGDVQPSA